MAGTETRVRRWYGEVAWFSSQARTECDQVWMASLLVTGAGNGGCLLAAVPDPKTDSSPDSNSQVTGRSVALTIVFITRLMGRGNIVMGPGYKA